MRRGKKPTRKQKTRLQRAGLSPNNWLVVKEKPAGELILLHRHSHKIKVVPASVGQPIQEEKIMNYIYTGTVSGHASTPSEPNTLTVFLSDMNDQKKPPAMLTAYGTLAQYIRELSCTDHAERYMRAHFHFNDFCSLQKIEVFDPKNPDRVLKTVMEGSDYSKFID